MQLFLNLPSELRIQIWEYALPGGRNIEIYPAFVRRKEIGWIAVHCKCSARCHRLPSIAHVNSEARAVFFHHFTTCFNTYVQWKNDTILIQSTSVIKRNLPLDAGSKEIQALDRIVSESPRSSELSSFAVTANRSWARNGLPHFLKALKVSEPQRSLNFATPFPELLLVVGSQLRYKGRRTSLDGLRLDSFNDDPMDNNQQLERLITENTMRSWRDIWEKEGKGTPPPFRMVTFRKGAPNCFKNP